MRCSLCNKSELIPEYIKFEGKELFVCLDCVRKNTLKLFRDVRIFDNSILKCPSCQKYRKIRSYTIKKYLNAGKENDIICKFCSVRQTKNEKSRSLKQIEKEEFESKKSFDEYKTKKQIAQDKIFENGYRFNHCYIYEDEENRCDLAITCKHYSDCLSEVCKKNWKGWTCVLINAQNESELELFTQRNEKIDYYDKKIRHILDDYDYFKHDDKLFDYINLFFKNTFA